MSARSSDSSATYGIATCFLAELIGTFFLTFVSAAPIVIGNLTGELQNVDKVVPAGALVAAMIYSVGSISGAHFNPAVTLAFAERRDFPWKHVPIYWIAQIAGSICAAATIIMLFGMDEHAGANVPRGSIWQSLAMEIIFTYLLVTVILSTANKHKITGSSAALAVGMTIALCGLVGGPVSGASMNPARSFGPALLGGAMDKVWIYVVGPAAGASIAALITQFLHGTPSQDEVAEAQGKVRYEHKPEN